MIGPQVIAVDTLTEAERVTVLRIEARAALCHLPPVAPGVEWTCDPCETVWRTCEVAPGQWEWLVHDEPDGCKHETIERFDDGSIGCLDFCGNILAQRDDWRWRTAWQIREVGQQ